MSITTLRNRTGTLQRARAAEMQRLEDEDEEKSLSNQEEEWKSPPQSDAPRRIDDTWTKTVEEGLSDIMKRLDQMAVRRNQLPAIIPNLPTG